MALSANKLREKEILAFIKSESIKRRWNFRGWQTFKIEEPFLVSVNYSAYGKLNCLRANLQFKPKDLDNLNCEISGKKDYFKNGPLYYKVNSFSMIFPFTYSQFEINDVTEEKMDNLLNEIDEKAIELVHNLSDKEKHYEFLKREMEKLTNFADERYLITLVYLKKYDELLATIKTFKENKTNLKISEIDLNNPEFNNKSFYDKLIDYVNNQYSTQNEKESE